MIERYWLTTMWKGALGYRNYVFKGDVLENLADNNRNGWMITFALELTKEQYDAHKNSLEAANGN